MLTCYSKLEKSDLANRLRKILAENQHLEWLITKSIALAAFSNPEIDSNPVRTLDDWFDFIERSLTLTPISIEGSHSLRLYERIDQGLDYFYFLLDQPLKELNDKGYIHPSVQYVEPLCSWIKDYCKAWGTFLSSTDSWNQEICETISNDLTFGVPQGWYESSDNWKTYNDFFSRKLCDDFQRPVIFKENSMVINSPADGWPQGIWRIDDDGSVCSSGSLIKSRIFTTVQELLGEDSQHKDAFNGGILTHVFLDVNDYHRYHFPVSGFIREVRKIEGNCSGGGVYKWNKALKRYYLECSEPTWESIETRGCVVVENNELGLVALLPVGMSQICSVNFSEGVQVGNYVEKGDELGYFLFGGSDFIIMFQKGVKFTPKYAVGGDGEGEHILFGQILGEVSFDK